MRGAIMVCGTASSAGKSLIVAALCRIFTQAGYRVAPFKSQNMALNSSLTSLGLELSTAQAVQAHCCNKEADYRMNPILLKSTGEKTVEVYVNGVLRTSMSGIDYFQYRRTLVGDIMAAYRGLESENDIIVIEGAGSPAEINLKDDDIVNMGLASMVDAPVVLVGDIDRGGVFASLYGTVALLEPSERDRVKGLIINKFRGDRALLDSGITKIEELTKRPVLGVVPYIKNTIEEEDSLNIASHRASGEERLTIGIIQTPRMASFSTFKQLEVIDGVSILYISGGSDLVLLDSCQMIIMPDSANIDEDLAMLRKTHIDKRLEVVVSCKPVLAIGAGLTLLQRCIGSRVMGNEIPIARGGAIHDVKGFWSCLKGCKFIGGTEQGGYISANDYIAAISDIGALSSSLSKERLLDALLTLNNRPTYYEAHPIEDYAISRGREYDRVSNIVKDSLDMRAIYGIMGIS